MRVISSSKICGAFNGWSGKTLFKLTNGQYWIQKRYSYKYVYKYRPDVQIVEENAEYFIKVEGVDTSIPVLRVTDVIESNIQGEFNGWDGNTTFCLDNGQRWQQSEYAYSYHYAYRPEVIIYNTGYEYMLAVEGINDTIAVRKIT